jgi:predicted secreted protein
MLISGRFIIDLKTNVSAGENSWELRNSNGEVLASAGNFLNNTTSRQPGAATG